MAGLALLLALSSGSQAQAQAEPPPPGPGPSEPHAVLRVVLLPVSFEGIDDASRRELLQSQLRAGLQSGGATLVLAEPASVPSPACPDAACWRELAQAHHAAYVVLARIVAEGRVYRMTLELHDADGANVAVARESCEVCGIADVATLLHDQAAALWVKLEDLSLAVPVLDVRSDPSDAVVELDGVEVGRTPLRITVRPGPRQVRVSKPGYTRQTRALEAVKGTRDELSFTLLPAPPPSPGSPRALRIVSWTSMGVAIGGLAAGSTLLALDGREARTRCSGDDRDGLGNCRYLRETTVVAAVTLSAAAVTAVVALTTGLVARRRARARPREHAALRRHRPML